LRDLNRWQAPQPIFGIVLGDDGAFADFSTVQSARFKFFVCLGPAWTITFAKLGNAHRSLPRALVLLAL
jgi:hypothetical protein